MIHAEQFVKPARDAGFRWWTGVPCSFLTPFINYVIDSDDSSYISSANEGDAVATAAGTGLAGQLGIAMMQNSGLGNAVNPLTSLAWPFRMPLLLIVTWRGDPSLKDEPQHKLVGEITPKLLETMEIPWELFPSQASDIQPALGRALEHIQRERRPYAFIMRKDTVEAYKLKTRERFLPKQGDYKNAGLERGEDRISRQSALTKIIENTAPSESVVIGTTGYTGRELYALQDRANHFYMVGSMGCAPSLGLGLALARPDKTIVVIDGDGAALMRMGNFATIGAYAAGNFIHILLDNEVHDSTGAQSTVSGGVSFARTASACGYGLALEGDQPGLIDALFTRNNGSGPRFLQLKTRPGAAKDLPRPKEGPEEVRARLQNHLGVA